MLTVNIYEIFVRQEEQVDVLQKEMWGVWGDVLDL